MSYCTDIADIIAGYRLKDRKNGDLRLNIDQYHVERWADQFPNNQEIILLETKHLLEQLYVTKADIAEYLKMVCTSENIWGYDPAAAISDAYFLNCQEKGNSQHRLWKKANKIVKEIYGFELPTNQEYSNYSTFIYLDDGMFSGRTLLNDIKDFLRSIPCNAKVYAVFLITHSFSCWWVNKYLDSLLKEKNIEFHICSYAKLQNSSGSSYPFDCLRPVVYESDAINQYIAELQQENMLVEEKKIFTFRDEKLPSSDLFTSEKNRCIFEQELMEAGLRIRSFPKDTKPYMRPMGYDNRITFGFGAFFATYMNMSNNCPLAYWWGDPNAGQWSPLGKWYPLLPRRTNATENAW